MPKKENQLKRGQRSIQTKTSGDPDADRKLEQTITTAIEQYSGALPHPQTLAQFNEVIPGLGERIIDSWEGESRHRQDLESRDIGIAETLATARAAAVPRGQYLGTVIALSGVLATVYMAVNGVGFAALGALSTLLVPIVSFLVSHRKTPAPRSDDQPSEPQK
jgi:uncharacterized membrane protein